MKARVMPDLLRRSYYATDPEPLTEAARQALWSAPTYREARRVLKDRELVPALTLRECAEVFEDAGIALTQVEVVPIGIEGAWRGEVVGQFPEPGAPLDEQTSVRLFVSHPAMRGRLPDGFIKRTGVTGEQDPGSADDLGLDAFQKLELARREEPPAGRVLRVFEAAIWRARLELNRIEGAFDGLGYDLPLARVLLDWVGSRPEGLDEERIRWLGNLVWMLAPATGPEPEAVRLLKVLLGVPVGIDVDAADPIPLEPSQWAPLGSAGCRLGADAVLGEVLDERGPQVRLKIGPLPVEDAAERFRSPEFQRLVATWTEALMPVLRPAEVRFAVAEASYPCRGLGAGEAGAVLGVTTRLGRPARPEPPIPAHGARSPVRRTTDPTGRFDGRPRA